MPLLAELGEEHDDQRDERHDGEDAEHPLPQDRKGGFESSHILFLLTSRAAARDSGSCRPRGPMRSALPRSRPPRASADGSADRPQAPSSG